MTDTIFINDLMLSCTLGVFEHERGNKQILYVSIQLSVDLSKAIKTDNINDTVNYHDLALAVTKLAEGSSFFLLEALAQAIAETCLEDKRVKEVKVYIEKPKAIPNTRGSAVAITRKNE
jgi:dihydroneopterin aldolase